MAYWDESLLVREVLVRELLVRELLVRELLVRESLLAPMIAGIRSRESQERIPADFGTR